MVPTKIQGGMMTMVGLEELSVTLGDERYQGRIESLRIFESRHLERSSNFLSTWY